MLNQNLQMRIDLNENLDYHLGYVRRKMVENGLKYFWFSVRGFEIFKNWFDSVFPILLSFRAVHWLRSNRFLNKFLEKTIFNLLSDKDCLSCPVTTCFCSKKFFQ
jgi:hypothetical protein